MNIHIQQLTKTYNAGDANEVRALRGINMNIASKDFICIVGPNGCGKSTLLNAIAGTTIATSGTIKFGDTDVTKLPEHQRSRWVARVFQNPLSGTAPSLSIIDNFRLAALRTQPKTLRLGISNAFRQMVKDRIATLNMGLENKIEQPMGTLSGGQRQALTLLMSVIDDAKVLLLDEPTAALDPKSASIVMQTAQQLITTHQLTAILITHHLKDAITYGNRLIHMSEGSIVRDVSATEKQQLTLNNLYEWFNTELLTV